MAKLTGRRNECDILDQFVDAVRGGASRAFVVNGEAGVGKTALLEYIADHAEGCRVVRALGVQTEMELAFATLHQLCAPLLPESVGLVLGTRALSDDVAGFEHLAVAGLREADARALLETALAVPIDAQVRDQIVAETGGNPLALLELPRTLTAAELAGGFGLPGVLRLPGSVEESFQRRVSALPGETRRLLVLAAADPVGDAAITSRAAGRLGIGPGAAEPAAKAGLADSGSGYRSATRSSARWSTGQRRARRDDRRTRRLRRPSIQRWTPTAMPGTGLSRSRGRDEDVAMELERSARPGEGRGGLRRRPRSW